MTPAVRPSLSGVQWSHCYSYCCPPGRHGAFEPRGHDVDVHPGHHHVLAVIQRSTSLLGLAAAAPRAAALPKALRTPRRGTSSLSDTTGAALRDAAGARSEALLGAELTTGSGADTAAASASGSAGASGESSATSASRPFRAQLDLTQPCGGFPCRLWTPSSASGRLPRPFVIQEASKLQGEVAREAAGAGIPHARGRGA